MRLSTIAVCLLVLSPRPALGCGDYAPLQMGWFHEMPSSYPSFAGDGAEESEMPAPWLAAAGSAAVVLVAMSFRAFSRAAVRERVQSDLQYNDHI
jgi:hypothetical protein